MRHRTAIVVTGIIALAVSPLAGCGTGPHLDVPTPGEEHYSSLHPVAIHAISALEIVVVGDLVRKDGTPEGLILTSETGGRSWHRHAVEVHDLGRTSFQTVYFGDRLRGWVGGIRVDDQGRTRPLVFRTEDGGNHWREVLVPQCPDMIVTAVHNLAFSSDRDGSMGVTLTDPATGQEQESLFTSGDAGRSWVAGSYRQPPKQPLYDHTRSFVDAKKGYRLAKSPYPGITVLETTGSGGQDWMPVCDLTLGGLPSAY